MAIRAISELVLALGADPENNSEDRIIAVARLIARRGFTAEEVRRAADHLAADDAFGEQVSRFKKAIIAQDFIEAREKTAVPLRHWEQAGFASEAEWTAAADQASEAWRAQVSEARRPLIELTAQPKALPPAQVVEVVPIGPTCPKHPDRELIGGDFCAACAVEEAMDMHRRGVAPMVRPAEDAMEAEP